MVLSKINFVEFQSRYVWNVRLKVQIIVTTHNSGYVRIVLWLSLIIKHKYGIMRYNKSIHWNFTSHWVLVEIRTLFLVETFNLKQDQFSQIIDQPTTCRFNSGVVAAESIIGKCVSNSWLISLR